MGMMWVLALLRCTRDGAALLLWGGSIYIAVLVPGALKRVLAPGWVRMRRRAAWGLVGAILAFLPVQAASLGRGWPDALDAETLSALMFQTTVGTAWIAQGAAALFLIGTDLLPVRWRGGATAVGAGFLLTALTLTGHSAMRDGWSGVAQRANAVLHLLAGGFWLGALVPLLPTLRALSRPRLHHDAVVSLRRFSAVGHGVVAVVVASGVANAAFVFGGWPADSAAPYVRLLAVKAALVATMVLLAIANRYVVVPRLARHPADAVAAIRRATLVEIACGFGAVALVALFGLLDPG